MKVCKYCKKPLNSSIFIKDKGLKSCPRCSKINGVEHVFLPYPSYFGVTIHRKTKSNPDGAQSYCVEHRGNPNSEIPANAVLCRNVNISNN